MAVGDVPPIGVSPTASVVVVVMFATADFRRVASGLARAAVGAFRVDQVTREASGGDFCGFRLISGIE